jgi:hypothetical protein
MKILLVNAFSDTKLGREEFHSFYGGFENIIQECKDDVDGGNRDIVIRRIDDLADIVLDWEHSVLAHNAAQLAHNFDNIDIICVCGNMKILPWMPECFDLIILMHMAHLLNKPMLTCGSAAYTAVYTCATQGARFHMVNQPLGDSLEHLKKFPYYYKGTKAYPCGWLDNETGDIFSYNSQLRSWKGVCNTGIYRSERSCCFLCFNQYLRMWLLLQTRQQRRSHTFQTPPNQKENRNVSIYLYRSIVFISV